MHHSILSSSSHERLSDLLDTNAVDTAQSKQPQLMYDKIFNGNDNALAESSSQRNKKKVLFKLDLRETFEGDDVSDEFKNDEYIIF